MFEQNTEFRVTIRDFQDRCEPQILKNAGPLFLRAVRECSADYLENCLDPDAELRWTVTLHQKLGIGTIHYAVYREGFGFEGKCLVYDLKGGPLPNRPWTPITMKAGELGANIVVANDDQEYNHLYVENLKGVCQPELQDFFEYYFKGWIPVSRISADMVEEDTVRTLIGAGFSTDLVFGTPEFPRGMKDMLYDLRDVHNSVVKNRNHQNPDAAPILAAREYEFDHRPAKDTLSLKVNYLKVEPTAEQRDTSFEAVFQEGGWLDGAFAKLPDAPQFLALGSFLGTIDFDSL